MSVAAGVVADETAKILAREYVAELDRVAYFDKVVDLRMAVTDAYVTAYLQGTADGINEVVADCDGLIADYDDLIAGYESKIEELVARIAELEDRPGEAR
jgi:hypothetical protein